MYRIKDMNGINFSPVTPGFRRKEEIPSEF